MKKKTRNKKKLSKTETKDRYLTGLLVAPVASEVSTNVFSHAATGLDHLAPDSPEEIKKYVHDVSKLRGIKSKFQFDPYQDGGAFYLPTEAYHDGVVSLPKKTRVPVAAHEFGHAQSIGRYGKLVSPGKLQTMFELARGAARYSPLAPAAVAALGDGNKTTEKIAPYSGLAMAAPMLLEEASANIHALRDLHKLRGLKGAVKGLPDLGISFASYLSGPAISGYLVHRAIKMKNDEKKKGKSNMQKAASSNISEVFWSGFDKKAEANWKHIGGGIAAGLGLGGIAGHMMGKKKGYEAGSKNGFSQGLNAGFLFLHDKGLINEKKLPKEPVSETVAFNVRTKE